VDRSWVDLFRQAYAGSGPQGPRAAVAALHAWCRLYGFPQLLCDYEVEATIR
jgi:hypothetical protein